MAPAGLHYFDDFFGAPPIHKKTHFLILLTMTGNIIQFSLALAWHIFRLEVGHKLLREFRLGNR